MYDLKAYMAHLTERKIEVDKEIELLRGEPYNFFNMIQEMYMSCVTELERDVYIPTSEITYRGAEVLYLFGEADVEKPDDLVAVKFKTAGDDFPIVVPMHSGFIGNTYKRVDRNALDFIKDGGEQ